MREGVPRQPLDAAHRVVVPTVGGFPPYCSCGFKGGLGIAVNGRPTLAQHIAEIGGY